MTVTFELPEEVASNLREQALAQGRTAVEFATEVVIERFGTDYASDDFPLDADVLEKIRRGFADMDAGRTVSLEDSRARVEGLLTARHMLQGPGLSLPSAPFLLSRASPDGVPSR